MIPVELPLTSMEKQALPKVLSGRGKKKYLY
jgi:hypothetical protein